MTGQSGRMVQPVLPVSSRSLPRLGCGLNRAAMGRKEPDPGWSEGSGDQSCDRGRVIQDWDLGPAGPSGQLLGLDVEVMPPVLQSTRGAGRHPPAPEEFVCFYVSSNVLKLLLDVQFVEWDRIWQRA